MTPMVASLDTLPPRPKKIKNNNKKNIPLTLPFPWIWDTHAVTKSSTAAVVARAMAWMAGTSRQP